MIRCLYKCVWLFFLYEANGRPTVQDVPRPHPVTAGMTEGSRKGLTSFIFYEKLID